MAVAASGRRADGDEHGFGAVHRGGKVAGEAEAAGVDVVCHELFQARLVDRHAAFAQGSQLVGVGLDHGYLGAEFGETGAGYQAHIAAADHRYTHVLCLLRRYRVIQHKAWADSSVYGGDASEASWRAGYLPGRGSHQTGFVLAAIFPRARLPARLLQSGRHRFSVRSQQNADRTASAFRRVNRRYTATHCWDLVDDTSWWRRDRGRRGQGPWVAVT